MVYNLSGYSFSLLKQLESRGDIRQVQGQSLLECAGLARQDIDRSMSAQRRRRLCSECSVDGPFVPSPTARSPLTRVLLSTVRSSKRKR